MTDSFTLSTEVWVEAPGVGLIPQSFAAALPPLNKTSRRLEAEA